MNLKDKIEKVLLNNWKVIENYFFMTLLQAASLLISVLLYPYLIRILGKDAYGTYIFTASGVQFFSIFITFGLDFPALKRISLYPYDQAIKSKTLSSVFTIKTLFFLVCLITLSILSLLIPFVRAHTLLYVVVFVALYSDVLFPTWYFQGIQKMSFVTYLNLFTRLLTIPFIFLLVKQAQDVLIYAVILSLSSLLGGISAFSYIRKIEKLHIKLIFDYDELKSAIKDALPFFWTSLMSVFKQESLPIIIGSFFNMGEVAVYDLANKIVSIIRLGVVSINKAIFPKVVQQARPSLINKIIRYEIILGSLCITTIILSGYWIILLLGGESMTSAYPLTIILSITILNNLIASSYIQFVFIPQDKFYFVTRNQIVSLLSYLLFVVLAIIFFQGIHFVVIAIVLSGFSEIGYCYYLSRKHQLL